MCTTRVQSTGISKGYVSEFRSRCHLHSLPCSQANVLIKDDGRACLADFGLLTMVSDQSTTTSSRVEGGMAQWMSPELLDPGQFGLTESRPTKESDYYALGMVIYEVLRGQAPFTRLRTPSVILRVLNDQRPERPHGKEGALFTDDLWGMLKLCWKHRPDERASAEVILQCLEKTSLLPRPHFDVDQIVETSDVGEPLDGTASDSGMFSLFCRRSRTDLQSPLWYNRTDYTC